MMSSFSSKFQTEENWMVPDENSILVDFPIVNDEDDGTIPENNIFLMKEDELRGEMGGMCAKDGRFEEIMGQNGKTDFGLMDMNIFESVEPSGNIHHKRKYDHVEDGVNDEKLKMNDESSGNQKNWRKLNDKREVKDDQVKIVNENELIRDCILILNGIETNTCHWNEEEFEFRFSRVKVENASEEVILPILNDICVLGSRVKRLLHVTNLQIFSKYVLCA